MSDDFKYPCRRRSAPRRLEAEESLAKWEKLAGAGSGGDAGDGGHGHHFDSTYSIMAPSVELAALQFAGIEEGMTNPHVVSIIAVGNGDDGRVEVHGTRNVYVSVGPPEMPPASVPTVMGVEVYVGEEQIIELARGLDRNADQTITMDQGGVTVDGGAATVTIQSMSEIKLQVANGASSITLTPSGIIIQGLLVQIN